MSLGESEKGLGAKAAHSAAHITDHWVLSTPYMALQCRLRTATRGIGEGRVVTLLAGRNAVGPLTL